MQIYYLIVLEVRSPVNKVLEGLPLPGGSRGQIHSLPFPASRGRLHFLALDSFSIFKDSGVASKSLLHTDTHLGLHRRISFSNSNQDTCPGNPGYSPMSQSPHLIPSVFALQIDIFTSSGD